MYSGWRICIWQVADAVARAGAQNAGRGLGHGGGGGPAAGFVRATARGVPLSGTGFLGRDALRGSAKSGGRAGGGRGLAAYPYQAYYQKPWKGIASLDQLQNVRAQGRRVWVLYTLERYIAVRTPDLMDTLRNDCAVQGVFRGTVGGGDVTVCAAPPVNAAQKN